jgi:Predicted integral membrane protein
MLTWIGSIVSFLSLILISITYVGFSETWLFVLFALIYLLGVQGITIFIHLPLNNHIQKLNLEKLKEENLRDERLNFANKWNFFNNLRTTIAF